MRVTENKNDIKLTRVGQVLLTLFVIGCLLAIQTQNSSSLLPATGVIFAGSLFVGFFYAVPVIKIPIQGASVRYVVMILLLTVWSLFSAFFSDLPQLSLQRTILVFSLILIVSFLVFSDSNIKNTFKKIAYVFIFYGSLASVYSLVLKYTGSIQSFEQGSFNVLRIAGITFYQKIYGAGSLRYASFFGNPNAFGLWLLFSLLNICFLIKTTNKHKLFFYALGILQVLSLLNTGSRAAIISSLLALVFFWAYINKRSLRRIVFWFASLLFLLSIPFIINLVSNFRGVSEGLSDREVAWKVLIESIKNKPLLGEGFGLTFESILLQSGVEFGAHNVYLSLLSEVGLIGFLFFMLFWFWPLIIMFLSLSRINNGYHRTMTVTALSIVLGLTFNQFFENSLMRFSFTTVVGVFYLSLIVKRLQFGKK